MNFANINNLKRGFLPSLFFILSITAICYFPNEFSKKNARQIRFAWPAEYIERMVLGYKLPVADFFWLRFIQDIGYKDSSEKIHLGWGYRMADAITNLDKRYRIVYVAAGTVLSVEVEDFEGAKLVLEKGTKHIPEDWVIPYRLGYHYLYELKDCRNAAIHFNNAAKNGAPEWLASLTARLYTASGQFDIAYKVTLENLERFKGTYIEEHLQKRLADLEKARQGIVANPNHPSNKLCQ